MKRRQLSLRHVRLLYKRQNGICAGKRCGTVLVIGPRGQHVNWIDEHLVQLALGGTNALSNRALYCIDCANRKTNGTKATSYGSDAHARRKVRHIRGENKPKPKRKWPERKMQSAPKMKSRPFPKAKRKMRSR